MSRCKTIVTRTSRKVLYRGIWWVATLIVATIHRFYSDSCVQIQKDLFACPLFLSSQMRTCHSCYVVPLYGPNRRIPNWLEFGVLRSSGRNFHPKLLCVVFQSSVSLCFFSHSPHTLYVIFPQSAHPKNYCNCAFFIMAGGGSMYSTCDIPSPISVCVKLFRIIQGELNLV